MAMIDTREQVEKEIEGNRYMVTAFPALYGVQIFNECSSVNFDLTRLSPGLIKDVIVKSVSVNNVKLTEKSFETHFSKKYKVLFTLFNEILAFNFEDMTIEGTDDETEGAESPNE